VRLGAADAAPTAPHATPRPGGSFRATGPERFWKVVRWQVGLLSMVVSIGVHYAIAPWSLLPQHEFEFHDVDGTLTIPVDLVNGDPAPPPPPEPPPLPVPEPPRSGADVSESRLDASARKTKPTRDSGADGADGAEDAAADAQSLEPAVVDAGGGEPAFAEPGAVDAAVAWLQEEAGAGSVRDAVGMIGAAGSVQAGPQNVVLTVNMSAIRQHPEGKRLGPLISAIPQWNDFIQGTQIDPLRDIDWISINGPALIHTEKDVILVHYGTSDAEVDKAVTALSVKHGDGRRVDVGVPGVKAVRGRADNAERIFLRPQSHVLAVVPRDYAKTAAQILVKAKVPRDLKRPGEAMRLTLVHPHGPMRSIPESVTEVRLWIVPRNDDGGADVYGEGDTASASACEEAVAALTRILEDQNSLGVQLLTHGLLNKVDIHGDGPTVRFHVPVSRDQIEVILAFVGGRLGVPMPPLPVESATSTPPVKSVPPVAPRVDPAPLQ